MKTALVLLLLSTFLGTSALPSQRPSCYKRALEDHACHNIPEGTANLRQIHDGLQDHFWEGKGCKVICYCNLNELLCCPNEEPYCFSKTNAGMPVEYMMLYRQPFKVGKQTAKQRFTNACKGGK